MKRLVCEDVHLLGEGHCEKDKSVLTNEVHHNQVEDGVSEQEVGKGSLWGDGQEVTFVLWVDLDPKTHYKKNKECKKQRFSTVYLYAKMHNYGASVYTNFCHKQVD